MPLWRLATLCQPAQMCVVGVSVRSPTVTRAPRTKAARPARFPRPGARAFRRRIRARNRPPNRYASGCAGGRAARRDAARWSRCFRAGLRAAGRGGVRWRPVRHCADCLLGEQLARFVDVARHEHAERDPQGVRGALVERRQFLGAFRRKLEPALDLLGGEFAQVLVDDVADMLEIDGEGNDFHRPLSLALVEAAARQLGHDRV